MKKTVKFGAFVGMGTLFLAGSAAAGTVRAQGYVQFATGGANGGTKAPLAGVRVKLLDDELIGTTLLKTAYTDSAGKFDITVTSDDGYFQGKLDPLVVVDLESNGGKIVVESEVFKVNVSCASGVKDETEGTINFGNMSCGGSVGADASTLFFVMKRSYDKFTELTGQASIPKHSGVASTLFPCLLASGVPFTTEESTHWPGGYRNFSRTPGHEFGHRIRHAQDGDFAHFLSDVASYTYMQQHALDKVTNEGFAFNEGWAEYNAAQTSTESRDALQNWTMLYDGGNKTEGNVGAKLFKISAACGGYKRMWKTLQSGTFHKYSEFANKVKADFNADATLRSTYPSCVSSVVASIDALERENAEAAKAYAAGPTMMGAFAPGGTKASLADITATVTAMTDGVKDRAAKQKSRNRAAANPKLRALGENLVNEKDAFEKRAAQKFEAHMKKLTLHGESKAELDARRAEHVAFLKDLFQDRAQVVEKQIKAIEAEKAKNPSEAPTLDKLKAKADALLARLKKAAQSGEAENDLLPRSFGFALEVKP